MQDRYGIRAGDRVIFQGGEAHTQCPRWYPPVGTVGRVLYVGTGTARVQWPAGCTGDSGRWYAPLCELAVYQGRKERVRAAMDRAFRAFRGIRIGRGRMR